MHFPQKTYKLSKTNIFFSHFEGTRKDKNQLFRTLDTVCKKPCNFLDIRTGARNFEPRINDTRFYAYYINKVAVR